MDVTFRLGEGQGEGKNFYHTNQGIKFAMCFNTIMYCTIALVIIRMLQVR